MAFKRKMPADKQTSGWAFKPGQLLWKLSDRARQLGEARHLHPSAALGRLGEDMAHRYLHRAGFRVVSRNFRLGPEAEVDIVARRGELLVFVEVKTRTTDAISAPERAVGGEKERHILRAAQGWVSRAGADWGNVRFDVISIVMSEPPSIIHHENSFVLADKSN